MDANVGIREETTEPLSFGSRVRGRDSQEIDLTLGRLAADAYEDADPGIDGWRPLSDRELKGSAINPKLLVDSRTGFAARIYTDDKGHYVLSFRGTDEGKDWVHNVRQGIG